MNNTTKIVQITRRDLIRLLIDNRRDELDTMDTEELLLHGFVGFNYMTNAELERKADEWEVYADDGDIEDVVRYHVYDVDTSTPSANALLGEALRILKGCVRNMTGAVTAPSMNQCIKSARALFVKAESYDQEKGEN